ncbi:MAG: DNA polymerase III subunit gamma/tau [Ruminococcus sp.]|nr:DNA polymerase III subunit gamma/tau [Ruminococcus sp.]
MYQALYRKYRPMSFDDVVSQPHITSTLKNQILNDKTAHAYLFTGSRGTGKTTCARIFAKAINCLNPKDGEPCLECDICKNADNGSLADIIEIDAASNAKVDDIRELREGVVFTPELCKYKVYIIDEVHMLSPGAFNALLKTMEEPPPHVKFILATTEVHKVPATIVSRCQHFDFRRIRSEDIVERLKYIASKEGFSLNDDAAALIARLSDGGMRDALSLLDQCVAFDNNITIETVSNAAGIAGRDYLFDILDKIIERNTAEAIRIIDQLYDMSKDLKVLCSELLSQMRNVMLVKTVDNSTDLITCLPEETERLKALANSMSLDRILDVISILQQCNERFAIATNKRIELEMCIVKLCTAKEGDSKQTVTVTADQSDEINALTMRIAQLESEVKNAQAVKVVNKTTSTVPAAAPAVKKAVKKEPEATDPVKFTPLKEWPDILEKIKEEAQDIAPFLMDSKASINGNQFLVVVTSDFFIKKFQSSNDKAVLKKIVNDYYGKDFDFKLYSAKAVDTENKESPVDELLNRAKDADIKVEIKK